MKRFFAILLLLAVLLGGCRMEKPQQTEAPEKTGALNVHFIDVGQADSILLECGGKYMLIDGGNVEDSSRVVSYLQKQGVQELEMVVCTHAHEDHVGGLPGVLAVFPTGKILAPTRTYGSNCFDDFVYYADQQRQQIHIPSAGEQYALDDAQITVLGPVRSYAETNDTSIVLLVTYGENRFLFTGDMETAAENEMLDYWEGKKMNWDVDVLKVGHHGSNTSTGYRFLYETQPEYGVISVGTGNTYGHPHDEPMSRLKDAQVQVYRTDLLGTVIVTSNGKQLSFAWQKNTDGPQIPQDTPTRYIGNINSKVLHLQECASLPAQQNQVVFEDYEAAVAAGYRPCSKCME